MNMFNKIEENPFLHSTLLVDDVDDLINANALDGSIKALRFKALKIMHCERRAYAGEDRLDERLLFVSPPPFEGWSKTSLYETLDKFLAKCTQFSDFASLQVYLGGHSIR